jgi:hypothetical protein
VHRLKALHLLMLIERALHVETPLESVNSLALGHQDAGGISLVLTGYTGYLSVRLRLVCYR